MAVSRIPAPDESGTPTFLIHTDSYTIWVLLGGRALSNRGFSADRCPHAAGNPLSLGRFLCLETIHVLLLRMSTAKWYPVPVIFRYALRSARDRS